MGTENGAEALTARLPTSEPFWWETQGYELPKPGELAEAQETAKRIVEGFALGAGGTKTVRQGMEVVEYQLKNDGKDILTEAKENVPYKRQRKAPSTKGFGAAPASAKKSPDK